MTNKYCHYTSFCIMKNTLSFIMKNEYCHYTRSYIITTNIVCTFLLFTFEEVTCCLTFVNIKRLYVYNYI